MPQSHLLIMDPLEKLNLGMDSSLRLAYCLSKRGHSVYTADIGDLYWQSPGTSASCRCMKLHFGQRPEQVTLKNPVENSFNDFASIHMRKEPPFDNNYLTATWLMESAQESTALINYPAALREYNEKASIFKFQDYCQPALISNSPEQILEFIALKCNGQGIVKPLDLFGGKGIFKVNSHSSADRAALDETLRGSKPEFRIIQPFNERIFDGEIRVFTLAGEPLTWCLKKPPANSFLANTSSGATLHHFEPSSELEAKVKHIAQKLLKAGLYFVGFDIIGESLSEINVTSPRLLTSEKNELQYFEKMAEWVENFSSSWN